MTQFLFFCIFNSNNRILCSFHTIICGGILNIAKFFDFNSGNGKLDVRDGEFTYHVDVSIPEDIINLENVLLLIN